jgi:hypothetical protein
MYHSTIQFQLHSKKTMNQITVVLENEGQLVVDSPEFNKEGW